MFLPKRATRAWIEPAFSPIKWPKEKRVQSVFVLPTLNKRHVLHPRYLVPRSKTESMMIALPFIMRKYRFYISDWCGFYWHSVFGSKNSNRGILQWIYRMGNRLTTRETDHEHFLRAISPNADTVEFLLPCSESSTLPKKQLSDWINQSDIQRTKLMLWLAILPSSLFVAKLGIVATTLTANLFFSYNLYRVNLHFRAWNGAKHLKKLAVKPQGIVWSKSETLQEYLQVTGAEVTRELEQEAQDTGRHVAGVWRYKPGTDIHDFVLAKMEKQFNVLELSRSYRRARMQQLVLPSATSSNSSNNNSSERDRNSK